LSLLPLEFKQLLLLVLLQQLLEPFPLLPPPLLSFFFLLRLLLPLLQLLLRLPLALFLFLLPPLLDGVEPDGPRRPLCDGRSLDLLIYGVGILRGPSTTRPTTNGNGIPYAPRLGRLGGSPLLLGARRLDSPW
jgi:hypothetical protein